LALPDITRLTPSKLKIRKGGFTARSAGGISRLSTRAAIAASPDNNCVSLGPVDDDIFNVYLWCALTATSVTCIKVSRL
jgi:hypothetical protein